MKKAVYTITSKVLRVRDDRQLFPVMDLSTENDMASIVQSRKKEKVDDMEIWTFDLHRGSDRFYQTLPFFSFIFAE